MVAPIVAAEAGKRGLEAGKALAGDIYTRRWTSEKGKGKKKRVVEHELKVNGLSVAALAVGGALAAAGAGLTLWLMQKKPVKAPRAAIVRIVEDITLKDGSAGYNVYYSNGILKKRGVKAPLTATDTLTQREIAQGYYFEQVTQTVGTKRWYKYITGDQKLRLGDREGFSMGGLF